ncbi:MAG TPA: VOC family protein, partial [Gaiellaceae bacterium]
MSVSLRSVGAITLFVEDLPRSKSFYEEIFGLPIVWEDESSAVFKLENTLINLLEASAARGLI